MLTEKLDSTEDKLADAMQRIDALEIFTHRNISLSVQWMVRLIIMAKLFESGDQVCPVIIKMSEYNEKVDNAVGWLAAHTCQCSCML